MRRALLGHAKRLDYQGYNNEYTSTSYGLQHATDTSTASLQERLEHLQQSSEHRKGHFQSHNEILADVVLRADILDIFKADALQLKCL